MTTTAEPNPSVSTAPAAAAPLRTHSIDARRWADVAAVPERPVRAWIAERLFRRIVKQLPLRVAFPQGEVIGGAGADLPVMRLHNPSAFFQRLGATGLIGFGEAYMAGDWEADDLSGVLTGFGRQMAALVPPRLQRLRDVVVQHQPRRHRGTASASRRNISHHYDLSNELFALFLDPTLTYSSALFEAVPGANRVAPTATAADLEAAQVRKVERLLDGVGAGPQTSLLEIGTGWGELALRAAQRGARVTSITLSQEQQTLARQRVQATGVADRVDIQLRDYRSTGGQFDAVVSVEMIEAVGAEFWPIYFRTLDARVRPGGRVGLQAITMPDDRMQASRDTFTWIQKYIFPGGLIPSVEAIEKAVATHTSLAVRDRFDFGLHYAETLKIWRETFETKADEVDALGFDTTFRRMWSLYLAYSEAGFRSEYLNVYQYVFAKQ